MKTMASCIVVLTLAVAGCGKKSTPALAPPATNTAGSNPLDAPADYLGALNRAQKLAVKTVDAASVSKAIDLFHAQEDRFPKDLNELVTLRFLPAIPALPQGMRYDYNPQTGLLKVVRTP